MSFVTGFKCEILQVASKVASKVVSKVPPKVAIKFRLVKASAPLDPSEQFNGMVEKDGFAFVCSEEKEELHTRIAEARATLSRHLASRRLAAATRNLAEELTYSDMPALCITVTQEEMLAFQTVEEVSRKGVIIFVK